MPAMSRLIVIALIAGCTPEPVAAPATPVAEAPRSSPDTADRAPCETVTARLMKTGVGTIPERARAVLLRHCRDDLWSAELRACIVSSTDLSACDAKYTTFQHQAVSQDLATMNITWARPSDTPTPVVAPSTVPPAANTMPP
jgi:hypothetical protein